MRRMPAVAGQFYQGSAGGLKEQVRRYVKEEALKEHAIGVLSPHAGLMYSGSVSGELYSGIYFPDTFILLGPNHTGLGKNVSIMHEGDWEMPTGVVEIDAELAGQIMKNAPLVSRDVQAHMFEHSLEVQLPFIVYFSRDVKIVPILIMSASLGELMSLGEGISKAVQALGKRVVIVASSDMSHYVSDDTARSKDKMAIDRVLALDPEGLYETVRRENISMCGYMPAVVMLYAAKALGAKEARLVKYTTSGEVSGDYEHVVGYAGVIIK